MGCPAAGLTETRTFLKIYASQRYSAEPQTKFRISCSPNNSFERTLRSGSTAERLSTPIPANGLEPRQLFSTPRGRKAHPPPVRHVKRPEPPDLGVFVLENGAPIANGNPHCIKILEEKNFFLLLEKVLARSTTYGFYAQLLLRAFECV